MYLPVSGANRDRTTDMMRYRGNTIKSNSITSNQTIQSPLEKYFDLSNEIKTQINRFDISFDNLVRKQQECLRPTFADSSDLINQINSITNSINSKLVTISQQINTIQYRADEFSSQKETNNISIINKDRQQILNNLRTNLYNLSEEFSFKFQTSQQAFLANYRRFSSYNTHENNTDANKELSLDDFSSLKAVNGIDSHHSFQFQQQQIQQEQTAQIAEIARREQELHGLFLNLSNMIIEQGSIIDRIDYCVSESLQNAEVAHKEVEKAAEYQKKSRMWKCAIFLSVFVLVLIVMALIK